MEPVEGDMKFHARIMEDRDTQIRRIAPLLMQQLKISRPEAIDRLCRMTREQRLEIRNRHRTSIGGRRRGTRS